MIEDILISKGIVLSEPSAPLGSYIPVVIVGNIAYTSGQISSFSKDNMPFIYKGKLGKEISLEEGQKAARMCTINGLSQLKKSLGTLDRIKRIIKVTGFVNSENDFFDQHRVIDGASNLLAEIFGEAGRHARSSIGVYSLPMNSCVEIEFIVELK